MIVRGEAWSGELRLGASGQGLVGRGAVRLGMVWRGACRWRPARILVVGVAASEVAHG